MSDETRLAPPPPAVAPDRADVPAPRDTRALLRRDETRHSALRELFLVRLREFVREPEALFWTFIFPVLLAAGLGIAFRSRPAETVHVGVLAGTPATEATAAALRADSALQVRVLDDSGAARALRTGRVALVVARDSAGAAVYRFDPSRPEARTARLVADAALQRAAGRRDPVAVREAHVSERGSRYIDFLIPGLLGLNLMGSGIWSIGYSIVVARNKKLLKRLVATPMSRAEYLFSFLLSRLAFLVLEVVALVGFGVLVFDVPMRGSPATLALVTLVAALSFSAVGLLVSSRARTVEAVSGLSNLVMLPMWVFSGVFFASSNFPAAFQPFIQALPLTATVDALRATMLEGAPLSALGGELAVLAVWLVVAFAAALRIFRWR
ncbi:MAG TPA: ABC transporter permease [Gemmatimonadaceae bacterium]|nr:ABC transporter permease [Gemmatimonadaceae bacterium]